MFEILLPPTDDNNGLQATALRNAPEPDRWAAAQQVGRIR